MTATDQVPHGLPPSIGLNGADKQSLSRLREVIRNGSVECCLGRCEVCREWEMVVKNYSRAKLTYPDDRPFAIDGLATVIGGIINDSAIFGFFRAHLR